MKCQLLSLGDTSGRHATILGPGGSTHLLSPFRLLKCLGEKSSDSARGLPTATALVNHTMFQLKLDSRPFPISNNKNKKRHVGLRNLFQSSCMFFWFSDSHLMKHSHPYPCHVVQLLKPHGYFNQERGSSTARCYNTWPDRNRWPHRGGVEHTQYNFCSLLDVFFKQFGSYHFPKFFRT